MTPAERVARAFHDTYERLAPAYGYETREASRTHWVFVPAENKKLMIAVAQTLLDEGVMVASPLPDREIDWRARAVAHAEAVTGLLQDKESFPGTFGETWLTQARETVSLDLQRAPFGAGLCALAKDKTLVSASDEQQERGDA